MSDWQASRRAQFKASIPQRDSAASRIKLRKQKRDTDMKRRRMAPRVAHMDDAAPLGGGGGGGGGGGMLASAGDVGGGGDMGGAPGLKGPQGALGAVVEAVRGGGPVPLDALVAVRRLVCTGPETYELVAGHKGALRALVAALRGRGDDVAEEAAWILTNVSQGDAGETRQVIEAGAMPALASFLSGERGRAVTIQALWCMANLLADGADVKDLFMSKACLTALLRLARKHIGDPQMRAQVAFVLTTLAKDQKTSAFVAPSIPAMIAIAQSASAGDDDDDDNEDALADALTALDRATSSSSPVHEEAVGVALGSGAARLLIAHLGHPSDDVKLPAIRALTNITMASDEAVQRLIDGGLLDRIEPALKATSKSTACTACLLLSNVAAGTEAQARAVCSESILRIVTHLLVYGTFETKSEALWVVRNALDKLGKEAAVRMLACNAMRGVVDALGESYDLTFTQNAVVALEALLSGGGDAAVEEAEELEAPGHIEDLTLHENPSVAAVAARIGSAYFDDELGADEGAAADGWAGGGGGGGGEPSYDFSGVDWS